MHKPVKIPALLALLALLVLGGCDRGDGLTLTAETDEPLYRQGQQLSRQGRTQEALNAYLKLISKRDDTAPESHLEAGLILLRHVKDPVAAYYHFRKYLELQPNSRQAVYVRGLIETAKREYARTLPGAVMESQAERMEMQDQIDRLLRENDRLKAELAALRDGVTSAPPVRSRGTLETGDNPGGPSISLPSTTPITADSPAQPGPATEEDSPITYAPVENPPSAPSPRPSLSPAASRAVPTKPTAPGRRHTVARGDTLFSLAQRYYGNRSRWRDIFEANRDVLPKEDALRVGMELRIP
ncbi:MAG: LysM peptidoglycan-binding domain-containing protein [Verrucomicrobia bacterium]|nr:LysM peptidoglycan-binding domain-containing protein [Verrucomicrobiota bacterium]